IHPTLVTILALPPPPSSSARRYRVPSPWLPLPCFASGATASHRRKSNNRSTLPRSWPPSLPRRYPALRLALHPALRPGRPPPLAPSAPPLAVGRASPWPLSSQEATPTPRRSPNRGRPRRPPCTREICVRCPWHPRHSSPTVHLTIITAWFRRPSTPMPPS